MTDTPVVEVPAAEVPPPEVASPVGEPSLVSQPPEPAVAEPPAEVAPFDMAALKLPEGFELPEELKGKFTEIATKSKLGAEAAQSLIDLHAETVKSAQDSIYSQWTELHKKWVAEVKADPELGDSQGLRPEVHTSIGKLLDEYGGPEIRQALDLTGAGNNPQVVRFLAKVAGALTEGGHVVGAPAAGAKNAASIFYPGLSN